MHPLTDDDIRSSLINASLRERKAMTLLPDIGTLPWADLDFLGWRDAKIPGIGYVIVELDEGVVGIVVRQAEGRTRARAQCSWCEDVQLPNDVVLFSAKRTGKEGRNGNVIATLACANFECSANVRKAPPIAYLGFDVDAERSRRIETLGMNARNFVRRIRDGD